MEYSHQALGIFGGLGLCLWICDFLEILNRQEILLPITPPFPTSIKKIIRMILLCMGILAWGLISYALMGPRQSAGYQQQNMEVRDIFFVFDTSRSMLANDFTPNRLEVAREKLKEFINLEPSERIGIVTFSEELYTLLPLTTDLSLAAEMVEQIKVGDLGNGTNIGDALTLAIARLRESKVKNKVIVLLTDGVSQVDSVTPNEAAQMAKSFGIKIYTVAIGTDSDALIPISQGAFGTSYQTIPGGSVDFSTLEEMTKITAGKSFRATDAQALQNVLAEIQRLESTKIEKKGEMLFEELFYQYLFWGIFLLLAVELVRRTVFQEVL